MTWDGCSLSCVYSADFGFMDSCAVQSMFIYCAPDGAVDLSWTLCEGTFCVPYNNSTLLFKCTQLNWVLSNIKDAFRTTLSKSAERKNAVTEITLMKVYLPWALNYCTNRRKKSDLWSGEEVGRCDGRALPIPVVEGWEFPAIQLRGNTTGCPFPHSSRIEWL